MECTRRLDEIRSRVKEVLDQVVAARRDFHRYPELSGEEERTSQRLVGLLEPLGLHVAAPVGDGHGVVGVLRGAKSGGCIALRADMDALPIPEMTKLPFASVNSGVSHACGHDAHMAMVLGAAMVLSQWPEELPGSIKFMFQPAEETTGGARAMVEAGVLKNPDVQYALALHVDGSRPVGTLAFRDRQQSAATAELSLTITGAGGHAAYPHRGCDTVHLAAECLMALQSWLSRLSSPSEPLVLTWGKIQGGWKANVMAEQVDVQGCLRTTSFERTDELLAGMQRVIEGTVTPYNGSFSLNVRKGYPPVCNDPALGILVRKVWSAMGGVFAPIEYPTMGGEDFSYFSSAVPGHLAFIGCVGEKDGCLVPHSSTFNLDEGVLPLGVTYLVAMVLSLMKL